MKNFCAVLAVFFSLTVFGCVSSGINYVSMNHKTDAGQSPENYEQTVRSYLKNALKDPHSMVDFSVSEPILTMYRCPIDNNTYGSYYSWRVSVRYNAKNSYGGYVGLQLYYYWFKDESLVGIGEHPTKCPENPRW